jgi:hypothetical protein
MAEGPLCKRWGWKIWEEDLHCKRLEIGIETICPYPPCSTIGALCDHGGPWDMDNFQAARCSERVFEEPFLQML